MNIKSASGEISDKSEEHVTGNRRKGNTCYKVVEKQAELCSVGWKVELRYLTEETFKQSVEVQPALSLLVLTKCEKTEIK